MLIVLAASKAKMKTRSNQLGNLLKITSQPLPRHFADSGAHHLNRSHQWPGQERSPEQLGSKLSAGNGICCDSRWVVVGSAGDDPGPKRLQQRLNPTRWGGFLQKKLGWAFPSD